MARLAGHTLAGQSLVVLNRFERGKMSFRPPSAVRISPPRTAAALPYPTRSSRDILLRENQTARGGALSGSSLKNPSSPCPDPSMEFRRVSVGNDLFARPRGGDWDSLASPPHLMEHNPTTPAATTRWRSGAARRNLARANATFRVCAETLVKADLDLPELANMPRRSSN